MQFIYQPLTWGFFLVLVPLLIHLINLMRHRRVQWAAMEFLLQSYRKHRKWVWLKQLLLLLARIDRGKLLVSDFVIAAQAVDHVVDIDRLVDRPRDVELAVREVRVGQVNTLSVILIDTVPREHQSVPQICAEEVVDPRLGHFERRAPSQPGSPIGGRVGTSSGLGLRRARRRPVGIGVAGFGSLCHSR